MTQVLLSALACLILSLSLGDNLVLKDRRRIGDSSDPNCIDPNLSISVQAQNLNSVVEYIENGADMYEVNCNGLTPMQLAIQIEMINGTGRDIILAFFDHDYDVNHILSDGNIMLTFAITDGSDWAVDKMVEMGSLVNYVSPQGSTPLLEAVLVNRQEVVKKLQKAGAVYFQKLPGKNTFLHKVVERGNYTAVQTMLGIMPFLDDINDNDETALTIAVEKDSPVVMNLLLARGAYINRTNKMEENYVYVAAKSGSFVALPTLFAHSLTVNTEIKNVTALELAVRNNDTDVVKVLLNNNANVKRISPTNNETYLHIAARYNSSGPLQELLKTEVPLESLNAQNETALTIAVKQNRTDVTALLLPKLNISRVIEGNSYVHIGAEYGSSGALNLLLKSGASVDALNSISDTALTIAIGKNHSSVVEVLLANGADIKRLSPKGESYLYTAVKGNSTECLRTLLKHGILPDFKNADGETPLRLAVKTNGTSSAEILKSFGADINQRWGEATEGLMHLAAFENCPQTIVWLFNQGISLDVVDSNLATPLHYAASGGAAPAASELLYRGCCVNCRNKWNDTALTIAQQKNFTDVASVISSKGGTN